MIREELGLEKADTAYFIKLQFLLIYDLIRLMLVPTIQHGKLCAIKAISSSLRLSISTGFSCSSPLPGLGSKKNYPDSSVHESRPVFTLEWLKLACKRKSPSEE